MLTPDGNLIKDITGNLKVRSAEDWVTPEDEGTDPDITATNEFIIIRPLGTKQETTSGILLPEVVRNNTLQLMTIGRIVAVGEHAGKRPGVSAFERGEYVLYPKNGGYLFEYAGVKLVIVNDDAILARLPREDFENSKAGVDLLGSGVTPKEDKKGKL